jgi:hypothetical protein
MMNTETLETFRNIDLCFAENLGKQDKAVSSTYFNT